MAYAKSSYQKLLVEISTVMSTVIDGTMTKTDLDREIDFIKLRIPALSLQRERIACNDLVYVIEDVIIQNYVVHAYKFEDNYYVSERYHVPGVFGIGILLDNLTQVQIDELDQYWIWRKNANVYKKLSVLRK